MNRFRVGVIGGGLAGIAAALTLADGGVDVTLLERRSRLGGLTSSIERDGLSFDNGQHVFLKCCTAYREFLTRIGAADQVYLQPELNVPVLAPGGVQASLRRNSLPAPFHLALSLARYGFLSKRERVGLVRPLWALRRLDPRDTALDGVSFAQWLTNHGQSARAIEKLWNLIVQPTINVAASEASLALAVMVFRVGFLESSDGADMGWSKVPLAQLHGTNAQRTLDALGAVTLLNTSANSVSRSPDGSFVIATGGADLAFDAVIVATPPRVSTMLGVLPGVNLAERLGTSPIVNIHLVFDRKVTDFPMAACVDSPIEFLFDRSDASGVRSGQALVISLSAADKYVGVGTSELVPMFLDALGDLFPAAREAKVLAAVVTREHAATFKAIPGTGALRPATETDVPGVFLAGAWCATGWPATMEGAVRSGNEAATQTLGYRAASAIKDQRGLGRVRT